MCYITFLTCRERLFNVFSSSHKHQNPPRRVHKNEQPQRHHLDLILVVAVRGSIETRFVVVANVFVLGDLALRDVGGGLGIIVCLFVVLRTPYILRGLPALTRIRAPSRPIFDKNFGGRFFVYSLKYEFLIRPL
jgi:hypothetical protein